MNNDNRKIISYDPNTGEPIYEEVKFHKKLLFKIFGKDTSKLRFPTTIVGIVYIIMILVAIGLFGYFFVNTLMDTSDAYKWAFLLFLGLCIFLGAVIVVPMTAILVCNAFLDIATHKWNKVIQIIFDIVRIIISISITCVIFMRLGKYI